MDGISSVKGIDRRVVLAGLLGCAALMVTLRRRQRHLMADATLSALRVGSLTPVMGQGNGGRVLAVYFDYHCPACRWMDPHLRSLAEKNPDLRILYRELPILGPDSETAARIALSAQLRGMYFEVHDRLMQLSGEYTAAVATDIAGWLNVDPEEFRKDMQDPRVDAELRKNFHDARALGVEGTPSVVTARNIEAGGRNLQQLQELIDALKG
jgi:protein-disulfide isomerase